MRTEQLRYVLLSIVIWNQPLAARASERGNYNNLQPLGGFNLRTTAAIAAVTEVTVNSTIPKSTFWQASQPTTSGYSAPYNILGGGVGAINQFTVNLVPFGGHLLDSFTLKFQIAYTLTNFSVIIPGQHYSGTFDASSNYNNFVAGKTPISDGSLTLTTSTDTTTGSRVVTITGLLTDANAAIAQGLSSFDFGFYADAPGMTAFGPVPGDGDYAEKSGASVVGTYATPEPSAFAALALAVVASAGGYLCRCRRT